jgi:hypothetical protein
MKLRRLIYTSQATESFSEHNLLDLLDQSRAYNSVDDITGLLMHKKGFLLQVLEGESEAIEDLLNRLLLDTRHVKLKIVLDRSTEHRLFPNWTMGFVDFHKVELKLIPELCVDLSDLKVIQELTIRLPEVASFLLKEIDCK